MEIERFALHDGPGIRTVVFMQGCPLHCPWCSNPESQKIRTNLLHISTRCIGCGECSLVCPYQAISVKDNSPLFDRTSCQLCKKCATVCMQNAIKFVGEKVSTSSIMELVLRDKEYYINSGGGVTFSGGDPFVQFDALMELLLLCKKEGLHTAVETCGQVDIEKLKQAETYIDLFLFDIKHTNSELLKTTTGADLDIIIDNLNFLVSVNPNKVTLRTPIIPDFNNNTEEIDRIFNLAKSKKVEEIHLLAYHTLGKDKYTQMGVNYPFTTNKMITNDDLLPFKKRGEALGLRVLIGG